MKVFPGIVANGMTKKIKYTEHIRAHPEKSRNTLSMGSGHDSNCLIHN